MNSAGLAILSVVKFGFLVTARGGSGIVIAKLDDGSKFLLKPQQKKFNLISLVVTICALLMDGQTDRLMKTE